MQSPLSNQKPQGTVPKGPGVVAKSPGIAAISQSGAEDEHVEEYEPNIDFKPAIALPELVEKKTGEENETEVSGTFFHCLLCKLDLAQCTL